MIDPICKYGKEAETTIHYLLRSSLYTFYRTELLNDVYAIDSPIQIYPEENLLNTLLYRSLDFDKGKSQNILK